MGCHAFCSFLPFRQGHSLDADSAIQGTSKTRFPMLSHLCVETIECVLRNIGPREAGRGRPQIESIGKQTLLFPGRGLIVRAVLRVGRIGIAVILI